jgi:transcriptional regulator with XRE-family HTH domain
MEGEHASVKALYYFRLHRDFRKLLARRNFSQNSLGRAVGLSSGYVSQLIRGTRSPGPEVRKKLMAVFPDLSFDELFQEIAVDD